MPTQCIHRFRVMMYYHVTRLPFFIFSYQDYPIYLQFSVGTIMPIPIFCPSFFTTLVLLCFKTKMVLEW
uniref:Uncharacterized protein n=1 Tax=Arundo donax TaxID=35708 RepID=A0A0A9DJ64_ARUDO